VLSGNLQENGRKRLLRGKVELLFGLEQGEKVSAHSVCVIQEMHWPLWSRGQTLPACRISTVVVDILEDETMSIDVARLGRHHRQHQQGTLGKRMGTENPPQPHSDPFASRW